MGQASGHGRRNQEVHRRQQGPAQSERVSGYCGWVSLEKPPTGLPDTLTGATPASRPLSEATPSVTGSSRRMGRAATTAFVGILGIVGTPTVSLWADGQHP